MANHKSAQKRARQTPVRTERNRANKSRGHTAVKKAETAIASKDKAVAKTAVAKADKELQTLARKGVLHKNTVARRQSRLAKAVAKVAK